MGGGSVKKEKCWSSRGGQSAKNGGGRGGAGKQSGGNSREKKDAAPQKDKGRTIPENLERLGGRGEATEKILACHLQWGAGGKRNGRLMGKSSGVISLIRMKRPRRESGCNYYLIKRENCICRVNSLGKALKGKGIRGSKL